MSSPEEFQAEHHREDLHARRWQRYCELIREFRGPIRLLCVGAFISLVPHAAATLIERL